MRLVASELAENLSHKVSAVHVREIAPPKRADRIEWLLLTTEEETSLKEAAQTLDC